MVAHYSLRTTTPENSLLLPKGGRWAEQARLTRAALRRNPLGSVGFLLLVGMIVVAIFAHQIAPYDPFLPKVAERLQPPSLAHPFGTDTMGRDILSRVIHGSRISLRVAALVLAIALGVGAAVGAAGGYLGGLFDEVVMRVTDIFLAFPPLILALAVNAGLGPGIESAMFAVAFSWWPGYARTIRAQVLSAKNNLYVEAARAVGATHSRVLLLHVLPNCVSPTIVQLTLDAGYVVLTTAGLSFVGLGAQPPTPEWGFMVSEGRKFILSQWWSPTFPGLAICLLVMGFNLFGDFLRDLLDPRLRGVY